MADVKWLGQTCLRVRSRDATVLMDPVAAGGQTIPKQKADIVTLSSGAMNAGMLAPIEGEYTLIAGPGEYEVQDIFITGIRSRRKPEQQPEPHNTIYLVETEEMVFCHLGHLNQSLTESQVEALGDVDVLFIPIGGGQALTPAAATEVIGQIEPRLVIPMGYRINEDAGLRALTEFVAALGFTDVPREDRLTVRKNTLPETMTVTVLDV